jgi:succinoglycan biosynthesis transport protein ExoP
VSIIQFLRILWAWRWLTALATLSCLVGAAIVILFVPARWEAHTRIMLDVIKPDPLTGEAIGPNASAYAATQVELIKDYTVAGKAVDQLGCCRIPSSSRHTNVAPRRTSATSGAGPRNWRSIGLTPDSCPERTSWK